MPQTLQSVQGKIKYPTNEPRKTQYGMRINCVVTLPDGEEVKLWGDPDDVDLIALRKGQQVTLIQGNKGGWQLLGSKSTTKPQAVEQKPQTASPRTDNEKRVIAARVSEDAKLMKFCLQEAQNHCGEFCESQADLIEIARILFEKNA